MVSHTIMIILFFLVFYDIISMTSCPCPNSLTSASCALPFFTLHGYGNAVVNSALFVSSNLLCCSIHLTSVPTLAVPLLLRCRC